MNSVKAANNLVLNPNLEKENLRAFIPTYRTIRTGIVKDIPQHFDEADLLEFFDASCKVVEVKRLNRRVTIDGEIKYIPSRSVCLKFTGQVLPKYVFLCRTRHEVYPFIPKVKICFSRYRVDHHISKTCKSKLRCIFCGDDTHKSLYDTCSCKSNVPCINCEGDHLASSHKYPIVIRHKLILSLGAFEHPSRCQTYDPATYLQSRGYHV